MSKAGVKFAKFVFDVVDVFFDPTQNKRKMTKFPDVKATTDIAYCTCSDECKLDLYVDPKYQKDGNKLPVMFYIHGGGFVAGDKYRRRALSRWYADMGMYVVCVNYGLAPGARFPTPIKQLLKATAWVAENADKYGFDLDNMIISGDSAGGYFAAMIAAICVNEDAQKRLDVTAPVKFRGAVLNCGIYDIEKALAGKILLNMGEHILDAFAGTSPDKIKEYEYIDICNPINLINDKFPKTFITYAGEDFFCKGHGPWLKEKLDGLGVYNEAYGSVKSSDNHCYSLNWKGKAAEENNALTKVFVGKMISKEL